MNILFFLSTLLLGALFFRAESYTRLVPAVLKNPIGNEYHTSIGTWRSSDRDPYRNSPAPHNQHSLTRIHVLPQAAFAAACAWGVFSYVWNNIDEIKEKQAIAVNQTMTKQAADLKNAQDTQRLNIQRIQV